MRIAVTLSLIIITILILSFKDNIGLITPPGTVPVTDSLYIDETEISNISWIEYIYWNKRTYGANSPQYLRLLPDTNVWGENSINYFRDLKYREYPVVGISFEQANAYCKWRTERVIEYMMIQEEITDIKKLPYIRYRLPSEKEWKEIASSGYAKRFHKKAQKKNNGKLPLNFLNSKSFKAGEVSDKELQNRLTIPTFEGIPNKIGCYNMEGNVAEMIRTKGKAKGGSFIHPELGNNTDTVYIYDKPTNWLGFRCICDYFPRKK